MKFGGNLLLWNSSNVAVSGAWRPRRLLMGACLAAVAIVLACRPRAASRQSIRRRLNTHANDMTYVPSSQRTYCPKEQCTQPVALPLWLTLPAVCFLVGLSGLFSGLTLGLMGLDLIGLQIVQKGGNARLAQCAARIAPVRESGNQLLCTLLLGNVAVNSALSILTADLFDGTIGFLLSTALIVIFGEIIPQAACSRYALQVGAHTVPLVRVLICIFYLITKPMSAILDRLLGQEMGTVHSRKELIEMLKLQISYGAADEETGNVARKVAEGALSFRDKEVHEVMTPIDDAFMLNKETVLGYAQIREIFETGFSRIPVHGRHKHDYRGLLYTKDLILADPEDEMKVGDFIKIFDRKVESFFGGDKLVNALNKFKKGGTHMALVREANLENAINPRLEMIGILTLEDIMEEILQEEIVDETDRYVDVDNRVEVPRPKQQLNLGVFNPVWRLCSNDLLSFEEVSAIAAHLERTVFHLDSGMELSTESIEWLVSVAEVQNKARRTMIGADTPHDDDWLYRSGEQSEICTLVLQGRVRLRVGLDGLNSEAGAFSVLARDALQPRPFKPDFGAFLGTLKVRLLLISRRQFEKAKYLEKDSAALGEELVTLRQQRSQKSSEFGQSSPTKEISFNSSAPGKALDSIGWRNSLRVIAN